MFKDIKGYEGIYQVNEDGVVKSLQRYKQNHSKLQLVPERIVVQTVKENGYLKVELWKDNKGKSFYVHRLVAQAFIPNPNNLPQVNHKDEDKSNNTVDNLEWCDNSYNQRYGTKYKRQGETFLNNGKTCYRVAKIKDGVVIATYRSMREAERENNLVNGVISQYFRKGYSQCGGFQWERI